MARLLRRAELPPLPDAGERDQHVILHHVSWEQYVALADARGESAWPRLVYLEGDLEIMSPSQSHERFKKLIARLIEAYDEEREIGLFGFGSTTYRKRARERGLEPDECYCIGREKDLPDLAIEVVLTSGGVDKLAVYAGLCVPEVWFWAGGAFYVNQLVDGEYVARERSELLPELDLARVAELINRASGRPDREIVADFRRSLRR